MAVKLRGSRFANCECQAEILVVKLGKDDSNEVTTFFKYVAKNLWTMTFARDNLLSSSSRHQLLLQQTINVVFEDISRYRNAIKGDIPQHFESFKSTLRSSHGYNTRHGYLPRLPKPKTESGKSVLLPFYK